MKTYWTHEHRVYHIWKSNKLTCAHLPCALSNLFITVFYAAWNRSTVAIILHDHWSHSHVVHDFVHMLRMFSFVVRLGIGRADSERHSFASSDQQLVRLHENTKSWRYKCWSLWDTGENALDWIRYALIQCWTNRSAQREKKERDITKFIFFDFSDDNNAYSSCPRAMVRDRLQMKSFSAVPIDVGRVNFPFKFIANYFV